MSNDIVIDSLPGAKPAAPKKLQEPVVTPLSNKEKCRYRSKVSKKLETMGIKDEITYVVSARKKALVLNPETQKMEVQVIPRYTAQNLRRKLVKDLTSKGKQVVESFLNMDMTKFKGLPAQPNG